MRDGGMMRVRPVTHRAKWVVQLRWTQDGRVVTQRIGLKITLQIVEACLIQRVLYALGIKQCPLCGDPCWRNEFERGEQQCRRCSIILARVRQAQHQPDICPECQQPMRIFWQSSADTKPFQVATCRTPGCALETVTLTLGYHARLTAEQIAGYASARARMQAKDKKSARRYPRQRRDADYWDKAGAGGGVS